MLHVTMCAPAVYVLARVLITCARWARYVISLSPQHCPLKLQSAAMALASHICRVRPAGIGLNSSKHRGLSPTCRSVAMTALLHGDTFFLDNFALRQWDDPSYGGSRIQFDKAEFVKRVHQAFHEGGDKLVDGYAPFCKHIFVPNFVGAKVGNLEITDANRQLLRSGYVKRRPEELAVLSRWFVASEVEVPEAKWLDIILYSREQLVKEYAAMPSAKGDHQELPDVPWGIISVKAQDESYETPMQPITMLRNALGREEGGSGVPIDKAAYDKSVEYWETHATLVNAARPSGE